MVLLDEPVFPGILITARLIGAIEAEQGKDGQMTRNDRLIVVASACQDYGEVNELTDLNASLVTEIEHFFVSYNQIEGKKFKPIGRPNAKQARKLLDDGRKHFKRE